MSTRPGLSFPYRMLYMPPINRYANFIGGIIRYMAIKYVLSVNYGAKLPQFPDE